MHIALCVPKEDHITIFCVKKNHIRIQPGWHHTIDAIDATTNYYRFYKWNFCYA